MTPFTSEGCQLESLPAQEEVVTMDARALSKYQPIQQPASPAIVFSLLEDDTGRSASPASEAPDGGLAFASASQVAPGRPDSLFSYVRPNSISLDLTRGYTYSRTATPTWDQGSVYASSQVGHSIPSMPPSIAPTGPIPPIPLLGLSSLCGRGRARSGSGRSAFSRRSLYAVRPSSSVSMRPGSSGSSRRSLSRPGAMTPFGADFGLPVPPHRNPYQDYDTMSFLDVEEAMIEEMASMSLPGSRPTSPVRHSGRLSPASLHGSARRWFRSSGVVTPPPSLSASVLPLWNSNPSSYRPRSSTASSSLVAVHGTGSSFAALVKALARGRSQNLNTQMDSTSSAQEVVPAEETVTHESSPDNIEFAKSRYIPATATKVGNDASAAQYGTESNGDDSIAFEEMADEENVQRTAFKMDLRRRSSYPIVLSTVSSPHFLPPASGSVARFSHPQPRTQPTQTRPLPISNDRLSWFSAQTSWSDRFGSRPGSPAASWRNSTALEDSARSGAGTPSSFASFSALDFFASTHQDHTTPIGYVSALDPGEDWEGLRRSPQPGP
ncbi:unnamed protein product [Tilletia controversa]|uniref:Uncharacterized protein n=3 Tax=Tilletia TaxID=13289 RepID=A0A177T1Y4_9BASI|nr:hypothetical protein CF336_g8267 [Tilletia laevis]KAE8238488.1 hypothetical protein A4X03_0g8849 [Tilletia caries]CAD6892077.1 unnamed protein product [Tilletia caries]CAD6921943.1 unnamed protein product [Tilletia controversa]CAD6955752.1 unnamed protein product [Tilletia controversa]